jgi:hypothetical protein
MRQRVARNGQHTHDDQPIGAWTAVDAYTVRRSDGPVAFGPRRPARDGLELVLGVLGLGIVSGALWGWVWAIRAVLLPAWRAFWGG